MRGFVCRFRGGRATHHVARLELGRLPVALVLFNFVTRRLLRSRKDEDDERGRKQVSACFQSRIQSHGHRKDTRRQRGQDYFRGLRKNKGHTPIVQRLPFDRIGEARQPSLEKDAAEEGQWDRNTFSCVPYEYDVYNQIFSCGVSVCV